MQRWRNDAVPKYARASSGGKRLFSFELRCTALLKGGTARSLVTFNVFEDPLFTF